MWTTPKKWVLDEFVLDPQIYAASSLSKYMIQNGIIRFLGIVQGINLSKYDVSALGNHILFNINFLTREKVNLNTDTQKQI